jgi:hypothetical protein
MKVMSSPSGKSFSRIERIRVWWSPRGKSVRPIEPANSTSPTMARRAPACTKTTWPGVWPGQWMTFSVCLADGDLVAVVQPAVGLEGLDVGEAEHLALLRHALDPEAVLLLRPLDGTPSARASFAVPPAWSMWPWVRSGLSHAAALARRGRRP